MPPWLCSSRPCGPQALPLSSFYSCPWRDMNGIQRNCQVSLCSFEPASWFSKAKRMTFLFSCLTEDVERWWLHSCNLVIPLGRQHRFLSSETWRLNPSCLPVLFVLANIQSVTSTFIPIRSFDPLPQSFSWSSVHPSASAFHPPLLHLHFRSDAGILLP